MIKTVINVIKDFFSLSYIFVDVHHIHNNQTHISRYFVVACFFGRAPINSSKETDGKSNEDEEGSPTC